MAQVHIFPVKLKHAITTSLNIPKNEIDEVICIVKLKSGDTELLETKASFEFKCIASKLLDYEIKQEIDMEE